MNKPLYLKLIVWPLMFLAFMTLAELWAYMGGGYLLTGFIMDPTEQSAFLQALLLSLLAIFTLTLWAFNNPSGWRDGIATVVMILLNVLGTAMWLNWIQFWPTLTWHYDFYISIVVVSLALMGNGVACIKFIRNNE